MIKFFRKIRQQLLSENKSSKYLLYAIGEIILVVIGILIALQINIASEYKKERTSETTYLKGILGNLNEDIEELNIHINSDSTTLDNYTTIVNAFRYDSIKANPSKLMSAVFTAQRISSFEGNAIVFEDMKSSGKTSLIESDSLRYKVAKYYNECKITIKAEADINNPIIIRQRDLLFIPNIGGNAFESSFFPKHWVAEIVNPDFSFFELDRSSEKVKDFANRAALVKATIFTNRRSRQKLLNRAEVLKVEINEHLKNN
ncbi:MAG: hypothetical protein AB8F94_29785 [Saprospiraceae bacterium]